MVIIVFLCAFIQLATSIIKQLAFTRSFIEVEKMSFLFTAEYINAKSFDVELKYFENSEILNMRNKAKSFPDNFSKMWDAIKLIFGTFNLLLISGIILTLHPIALAVLGIVFFINHVSSNKLTKSNYSINMAKTPFLRKIEYFNSLINDFSFSKEIRIFNLKNYMINKFAVNKDEEISLNKKIDFNILKMKSIENGVSFFQISATYGVLIYEVLQKGMSIGSLTMYISAINSFVNSVQNVLNGIIELSKVELFLDDLEKFMSIPNLSEQEYEYRTVPTPEQLKFEFKNVSFKYDGSDIYALRNVNMTINPGERIAILGLNGAGKSTFIKLLTRMYTPVEGEILLNGININKISFTEYIALFAAVFQDFKLFSFSILENIILDKELDLNKLNDTLKKSNIKPKIDTLPLGVETQLFKNFDDNGVELSGGESQKLALARALYKDANVLLLDEPSSALDPLAEYELFQSLNDTFFNRTVIIISHRLQAVQFCNKIAVFNHNALEEIGTHNELMKMEGIYAEMYKKQSYHYLNS